MNERLQRLVADIESQYAGGDIVPLKCHYFGNQDKDKKCACGLGAAYAKHHDSTPFAQLVDSVDERCVLSFANRQYGMTQREAFAFMSGFDGESTTGLTNPVTQEETDFYLAGKSLAEKWCPVA